MLTFRNQCDRRGFIRIGSLGCAGLALPQILAARETQASQHRKDTAVILWWMAGGPSQIDTYDPKPDAPAEVRGPFKTIPTNVSGIQLCELLPLHAHLADKFALVRSLHHRLSVHDDASHWVQTGYPLLNARQMGQQYPSQGSVVSQLRGPNVPGMPPYVCFPEAYSSPRGFYQRAAFLGSKYDPMNGGGMEVQRKYRAPDFQLPADVSLSRVEDRRALRESLNSLGEDTRLSALENSYQRAFELVSSPAVHRAFDLSKEPARLRERYGDHAWGRNALLARRLVEAGVTFVTVNHYEADIDWWDDHYTIEKNLRNRLPSYDQALSALIADIHDRGLAERVLVVAVGEFGRAPKIDQHAGRGHWPGAFTALLSGGGVKGGRVVGSTSSDGGAPKDRPLGPGDLLATIYHVLGISMEQTLTDRLGRPVPLVESGEKIAELF